MEAKSTDQKTFQLTEDGQLLGELRYDNLFFIKAEIKLPHADRYEINPVGIFGTSLAVTQNGNELANLKMNWSGQIVLTFQDGQAFVFKSSGFFNSQFIIENKDGDPLIHFKPAFNWRKFQYHYDVTYADKPQDILLILLGLYASNYFIAMLSGAAAGMA